MARMEGQPYGVLNYQHEWRGDMTPNLLRSLVMNLLTAALLAWLVGKLNAPTLTIKVGLCVAVGCGVHVLPYSTFIWFKNPDIVAHMIDAVVPFALVGALNHWIQ